MIELLFALSVSAATLGTAPVASPAHEHVVEHRGETWRLSYHPHVTTVAKTVGMSVGSRMSTERCLWNTRVQVERRIAAGSGLTAATARLLPATHTIGDSRPGSCAQARDAIDAAAVTSSDKVRSHVAAVAAADRSAALAEIDATRALALN